MKKLLLILFVLPACGILDFKYADYSTDHGIEVFHGVENSPSRGKVERWTNETLEFWLDLYPEMRKCFYIHTSWTSAKFIDEPHTFANCGAVAGFQSGHSIEISNGPEFKVRGVYIHELSHVLAAYCFGLYGNDESHMFFEDYNLCSLTKYC